MSDTTELTPTRFDDAAGVGALAGAGIGALIGIGAAAGMMPGVDAAMGTAVTVGLGAAGGSLAGTIIAAVAGDDGKGVAQGRRLSAHPTGPFGSRRKHRP